MKIRARIDTLVDGQRHKAGTVYETAENTGRMIINVGWGEQVKEPAEEPKKPAAKKPAAKKKAPKKA